MKVVFYNITFYFFLIPIYYRTILQVSKYNKTKQESH